MPTHIRSYPIISTGRSGNKTKDIKYSEIDVATITLKSTTDTVMWTIESKKKIAGKHGVLHFYDEVSIPEDNEIIKMILRENPTLIEEILTGKENSKLVKDVKTQEYFW